MAASDRCPLSAKADSEEKERSYPKFSRLLTHFADGEKKKNLLSYWDVEDS